MKTPVHDDLTQNVFIKIHKTFLLRLMFFPHIE